MNLSKFFTELKRRNVYKVAIAYAVVGWLLVQVATQVFPVFDIPNWIVRLVVLVIVLGFPIALVLAWAYEVTPEGLQRAEGAGAAASPSRRHTWIYLVVVAGALSAGLFFLGRYTGPRRAPDSSHADKSIAVLRFENRSDDKANAYFADGIQDEILTRLAKIGDLKVISRTSTLRYQSSPENLRQIAQELGVAHVLEGSVQKEGGQVRVNVQLINAETDGHLWAEVYDRKLTDVLALESEIAQKIADSLRARLSGKEQKDLQTRPTGNPDAYDAYLRGKTLWDNRKTLDDYKTALAFFSRAVQLDPQFALSWAALSIVQTHIYTNLDATPQHLAEAKRAVDRALEIDPNLGEAYFALGWYRYSAEGDFPGALAAFEKAQVRGANRAHALQLSSYVKRRQGRWDEALALQASALTLDPRNTETLSVHAATLRALRRFADAHRFLDRALEITPNDGDLIGQKVEVFLAQGEFAQAGKLIEQAPPTLLASDLRAMRIPYLLATGRDAQVVEDLEGTLRAPENRPDFVIATYHNWIGIIRLARGENLAGREQTSLALQGFATMRKRGVEDPRLPASLASIYARLGNKKAVEEEVARLKKPIEKDAYIGPGLLGCIAEARAWLGKTDAAIQILDHLLKTPGGDCLTPALLRLDPTWQPLRDDPRFQKLCEGTGK